MRACIEPSAPDLPGWSFVEALIPAVLLSTNTRGTRDLLIHSEGARAGSENRHRTLKALLGSPPLVEASPLLERALLAKAGDKYPVLKGILHRPPRTEVEPHNEQILNFLSASTPPQSCPRSSELPAQRPTVIVQPQAVGAHVRGDVHASHPMEVSSNWLYGNQQSQAMASSSTTSRRWAGSDGQHRAAEQPLGDPRPAASWTQREIVQMLPDAHAARHLMSTSVKVEDQDSEIELRLRSQPHQVLASGSPLAPETNTVAKSQLSSQGSKRKESAASGGHLYAKRFKMYQSSSEHHTQHSAADSQPQALHLPTEFPEPSHPSDPIGLLDSRRVHHSYQNPEDVIEGSDVQASRHWPHRLQHSGSKATPTSLTVEGYAQYHGAEGALLTRQSLADPRIQPHSEQMPSSAIRLQLQPQQVLADGSSKTPKSSTIANGMLDSQGSKRKASAASRAHHLTEDLLKECISSSESSAQGPAAASRQPKLIQLLVELKEPMATARLTRAEDIQKFRADMQRLLQMLGLQDRQLNHERYDLTQDFPNFLQSLSENFRRMTVGLLFTGDKQTDAEKHQKFTKERFATTKEKEADAVKCLKLALDSLKNWSQFKKDVNFAEWLHRFCTESSRLEALFRRTFDLDSEALSHEDLRGYLCDINVVHWFASAILTTAIDLIKVDENLTFIESSEIFKVLDNVIDMIILAHERTDTQDDETQLVGRP